ncbi:MAG TPA: hypothetical protein VFQ90_18485 [Stellaceae bacterium]|jgi:hypothetical protein|nr:hypothetical protein [Stellaceae bacterium]
MRLRRIALVAVALISAGIGAHTLNPRQLYSEMYPIEPVKRDAFHICDDSDPTFVRAVGAEREACYDKMPHAMAVAMGRAKPGGALSLQALTDPSREAELLMMLAATPPRQPITAPRSFSNTAWVRALSPPCADKPTPAVAFTGPGTAPGTLPPAPGNRRAAALDSAIRNNLPPLPGPAPATDPKRSQLPVIALTPGRPAAESVSGDTAASSAPLPAPDVGDDAAPEIVPLATAGNTCGGA